MDKKYIMMAIDAALKAGEKILSVYEDPKADFEIERKSDNSPLTIADREAHATIAAILSSTFFPILSEEGKHPDYLIRRDWNTLWIVDPLDGTKEFISRNGEFTVNIALVQDMVPVLGVIYIPVKKELYFAAEEMGSYKVADIDRAKSDGMTWEQLMCEADRLPLKRTHNHCIVVASRSHASSQTKSYISDLKNKYGDIELISSGSSIKMCLVAEGTADVYPRFSPTMEWDTAAGHAIARMAGMEVYQVETGETLRYNKEDLLNPWFIVETKREIN